MHVATITCTTNCIEIYAIPCSCTKLVILKIEFLQCTIVVTSWPSNNTNHILESLLITTEQQLAKDVKQRLNTPHSYGF